MPYTKKQIAYFNTKDGKKKVPKKVRKEANQYAKKGTYKPVTKPNRRKPKV